MLTPSIFHDNMLERSLNSIFGSNFWPEEFTGKGNAMCTDISESDEGFQIDMELPGFAKENITAELKNGYMNVTASRTEEKSDESNTRFVHKGRYTGSYSRSFYVGKDITEEDIVASFNDGILTMFVPKKEKKPEEVQKKLITIS